MSNNRSDIQPSAADGNAAISEILLEDLPKVMDAALQGDSYRATVATRRLMAHLAEVAPGLAAAIQKRMAASTTTSALRQAQATYPAVDDASAFLNVTPTEGAAQPILDPVVQVELAAFLKEHANAESLRVKGLEPRWTVLLTGPPGTGKTMLARWLALQLDAPLAELDLSAAISSFLGRTGQNLSEVLETARRQRVVLLLDEFDALAKRRDDSTDLGELKRVVSVLLKELEEWTGPSVIIAATNHPELLDPAVFRRFQLTVAMGVPDGRRAADVLRLHFQPAEPTAAVLSLAADVLEGHSGSDLRQFAQNSRRRALLQTAPIDEAVLQELARRIKGTSERRRFCRLAVETLPRNQRSMERLAQMIGVAKSTVHSYLSE